MIPEFHEPAAIFGEQVSEPEQAKINGQRAQVEALMGDGGWHTIPQLQRDLKKRFGVLYAETSISARLRGLRKAGYLVESRRSKPGSGLYEYRATPSQLEQNRARAIALAGGFGRSQMEVHTRDLAVQVQQ
ncbi:MAG: hypothetical protein KGN79_12410 [Acidobacteriota bacterium]|nr:hypothetical protein [Acidobacteriota bacterium]